MATSSDDMAAASNATAAAGASSAGKPRKERTSMCSYCGMTFNKKEHLQRHERTHTLDRPYHCDFPGCGKAFARRDTLTRHTRLHQRDEVQGSLKLPLSLGPGDDDETSEDFTTPLGSKQVSPATSGSTAPASASAAVLGGGKGKKATHSRTGSIASQKASKKGSGSRGPSSQANSKKNTPEYKTATEDAQPHITPSAAARTRPRRAAAAALYDENALMDADLSSPEQDEMQEDSGNEQDHMIIPNEVKPDLYQVNSALAPHAVIGQRQSSVKVEDMIKPLLPSLHTSSYLARTLEAQHNQGVPHIKPSQSNPVPATAIAGLNQPMYNFGSWDQANNYPGGNQQNPTLLASSNNPNLGAYSSSANSSASSSGSTYNSSQSQLGSGGSASLASPYSISGSNQTQGTPGSALGLDLGLPSTPAVPILPTPQEVQHFQGFNFPGNNSTAATGGQLAGDQSQQQYRIPTHPSGTQQPTYETFPSFQGPDLSYHHQRASSTASAAAAGGNFFNNSNGSGAIATAGSQRYPNQSSPTAAQSFLAGGTSGPYSPNLSQRDSTTLLSSSAPSAPSNMQSSSSYTASSAPAAISGGFAADNAVTGGYKKKAPSFVPSFWAHMTVQHQEPPASATAPLPLTHQQYQQSLYTHMQHHRSATTSSFSATDDGLELLSNHSDSSSPVSAPSSLLSMTSPTLTTSMNLYSMASPASEVSALPSLSSSFSSAFSGDFFSGPSASNSDGKNAFKHRGSFMEPFLSLDAADQALGGTPLDLNAALLKAADAHTDQFINWPERDSSPCTYFSLSSDNAISAPSVNYSHSPASATSYLDLSEYDTTVTQSTKDSSLFGGDKTFSTPLEIALQSSSAVGKATGCGNDFNNNSGTGAFGRQSPGSSLEDWLIRQTSSNEYVL